MIFRRLATATTVPVNALNPAIVPVMSRIVAFVKAAATTAPIPPAANSQAGTRSQRAAYLPEALCPPLLEHAAKFPELFQIASNHIPRGGHLLAEVAENHLRAPAHTPQFVGSRRAARHAFGNEFIERFKPALAPGF